ncbi:unnamed protein product [Brassica napus]|uniref:(rape) hypothetical protein n=1 Tax=Brassica napus TaxID=3708 RepID=A0A816I898_BRANA|nr:unnamed protein product [Brassica napus]
MTIYLHEFIKSSLVDLHLKPSEEDLKQWFDSRIVRNKRNSGGQITEEESTNNTIYEWSTKPVRKCLTETLLPQPFL